MSLCIYPVFERKLKGTKFDTLGEVLAANFETLDNIAQSVSLTLFTAFADKRSIPEDFEGDPDDLAEAMGDWTEWFDPAEGQQTMQALANYIKANPKVAKQLDDSAGVLDELEEMARVLGAAAAQGIRFRLEMS